MLPDTVTLGSKKVDGCGTISHTAPRGDSRQDPGRQCRPTARNEVSEGEAFDSMPSVGGLPYRSPRRYEDRGEFARGGIGQVITAHDRDLERTVALKQLIDRNSHSVERFIREAKITARLEHHGIVPVYDAGRWPTGKPFYTMKKVNGRYK